MNSKQTITERLKNRARAVGFDMVGVCPAVSPSGIHHFYEWLSLGYAGEMTYLQRRRDAYSHPRHVLDGVRSLLMLGINYSTAEPEDSTCQPGFGKVSRYAWGADYHDIIHAKLAQLVCCLTELSPGYKSRGVVDTAPLLEREFAQLAGLGWIGKNTLLLNRDQGSWFFLAALLTDAELQYDQPYEAEYCGSCRACLDACPTQAFPQPFVLDATRCISYLTIELKDTVPEALRGHGTEWIFGCDICQDVCPWNHSVRPTETPDFAVMDKRHTMDLVALFDMSDEQFRRLFRKTALWRAKRRGLLRNAAIVLGNQRPSNGVDALRRGLRDDEPLIRASCAWALGQYGSTTVLRRSLSDQLHAEQIDFVRSEIVTALKLATEGITD